MSNSNKNGTKNLKTTIKDVARKADVAISTVSLVINDKGKVSEETRRKIQTAMRELNYRPSRVAQGLAGRLTGNIGFILSEDHFTRSEPFYSYIFLGSEFEARHHSVYVLLTVIGKEFRGQKDAPRFLLDNDVDGVLVAGRVPQALTAYLKQCGLPILYIDFLPDYSPSQAILIDNHAGAEQAVNHLIDTGRRQIAFIAGDIHHPSIQARFEGYRRTLATRGLPFNPDLTITNKPDTNFQYGYEAAAELIQRQFKFDAIFAANDALALGALRYFAEKKIKVPEEVALTGFDDVAAAAQSNPPLTTVRVNKEEMGILGLKTLVEIIQTRKEPNTKIIVPTTLIVRKSTGV
jgi:LacI family transcriptional regulator